MRILSRLLIAAALLTPASATTTEEVDVTCPVCANEFVADEWASTNTVGGQDRDFLEHAAGDQVFLISCWTCPKCRFSWFPSGFKDKVPKELVAKLKKENPLKPAAAIDAKLKQNRKIPAWVRYDLFLQALKLQPDVPPSRLAFVHMRTAQTQRFGWSTLDPFEKRCHALWMKVRAIVPKDLRGYDHTIACARNLLKLAQDGSSGLAAADRPLAAAMAACHYKRRGEDPDAARALATLEGKELEEGLQAVVDDVKTRIAREKTYMKGAVPHLEAQQAEKGRTPGQVTTIRYLLGVIHRKLGEKKKALAYLEPLLEAEGVPEGMLDWIRDEIAKTRAG